MGEQQILTPVSEEVFWRQMKKYYRGSINRFLSWFSRKEQMFTVH
jgi:hypothetical protein